MEFRVNKMVTCLSSQTGNYLHCSLPVGSGGLGIVLSAKQLLSAHENKKILSDGLLSGCLPQSPIQPTVFTPKSPLRGMGFPHP